MNYTRIYCAADGESHFDDCSVKLAPVDFAPPAPPLNMAAPYPPGRAILRSGAIRLAQKREGLANMGKRIVLSAVAGAVVIFVLAGLLFGVTFAGFFSGQLPVQFAGIQRTAPNYPMLFGADLLYAGMLATLFAVVAKVHSFRRGAAVGMLIGFSVVLHFDLISSATTYLTTPAAMALNAVLSTFMSGLGGGVIGAVLGRLERGTAPLHPVG